MKLGNKGFAITSIVYSILILFLALVLLILNNMAVRQNIFEKQKKEILEKFEIKIPLEYQLPDEYQEVAYLESNGMQFINTRLSLIDGFRAEFYSLIILPNDNDNVINPTDVVDRGIIGSDGLHSMYGSESEDKFLYRNFLIYNNSAFSLGYGTFTTTGLSPYLGEDLRISISTVKRNAFLKINNKTLIENHEYVGERSPENIYLFASNVAYNKMVTKAKIKCGIVEIYGSKNSTTPLREFIPCYRKEDNKPGMYDVIDNVFYVDQSDEEEGYEDFGVVPKT